MFSARIFLARKVVRLYREVRNVVRLTTPEQIVPLVSITAWSAAANVSFSIYSSSGNPSFAGIGCVCAFFTLEHIEDLCVSMNSWKPTSQILLACLAALFIIFIAGQASKYVKSIIAVRGSH